MKLTLKQIDQAYAACLKIKDEKLNIKTAYKVLKLVNELEAEFKNFEQFIKDIVTKYCDKDESGNPVMVTTEQGEGISIPQDKQLIVQQEIQELNETEVEIKNYEFTFNDFENLNISISELNGFMPFIKEEE